MCDMNWSVQTVPFKQTDLLKQFFSRELIWLIRLPQSADPVTDPIERTDLHRQFSKRELNSRNTSFQKNWTKWIVPILEMIGEKQYSKSNKVWFPQKL